MIQNYINHIAFVIDESGSMSHLSKTVVDVFDNQVSYLAKRSKETGQETRVSVYLFNTSSKCIVYDMDVLRLPSLASLYRPSGGTALVDATLKVVEDLQKTPELYADHAFLVYVLTDGQENSSSDKSLRNIGSVLNSLRDNWTVAVMVPDATGVHEAKRFGFPVNNISVWDVNSSKGLEDAGEVIRKSTDSFFSARSQGVRGTKNLFKVDVNFSTKDVQQKLDVLKPSEYELLDVRKKAVIKDFIESWKLTFQKGANYYQLTKPETIQSYKQVCIQDKINGKVYAGTNARKMLGLPGHDVKVSPGDFDKFDIFIQSTSSNRNLMPGTKLIVLK
jgi:hypothetical protein